MKVGWLYPLRRRCGIMLYGNAYTDALRPLMDILRVDSDEAIAAPQEAAKKLNDCDVVHVQYEPSLFMHGARDGLTPLLRLLQRPLIVSLHEVYEEFPWEFPRSRITGRGLIRIVKEALYDRRHPVSTAYRRHLSSAFFGARILVHHRYHRDILVNAGLHAGRIQVIPHPVPDFVGHPPVTRQSSEVLRLGCCGFLSESYDFSLCEVILESMAQPWTFTWIGGIRRDQDTSLENRLRAMIAARGWSDRYFITGWVDEVERNRMLGELHVFAAWFKYRSSSGSISVAAANGCLVTGTDIPCLTELAADFGIVATAAPTAQAQVELIERFAADPESSRIMQEKVRKFVDSHTYTATAPQLLELYRSAAA